MRRVIIDNRYEVLKKLGTGATGIVYKVRDLKDKKIIALKILSKERTSSETVQRFKREFRLLAGLRHPNLCSVYDFGMLEDGRSYFTMEYIEGPNIFEFTKNPVRKNISNGVYPLIVQLCRALEHIHSKGLIHYDVKPGNVLIAKGKEQGAESKKTYAQSSMSCVKLMDFGLAGEQRIKGGILIRGTLPYIAPEVIKGLAVDHRADLYSLGVLLYEIFTRRALYADRKTSFATFLNQQRRLVSEPPSKIVDIHKGLERLIMKLIAFEPAARFNRANEIIKGINKLSHSKFATETEKTLEGYLMSSKFVGRDKEMNLLKSLYDRALHGEGKFALITGDAGIGKSRLLKEFKIFTQMKRSNAFIGYAHRDKIRSLEHFHDIFRQLINYIRDESNRSQSRKMNLSLAVLFKIFPDLEDKQLKKNLPRLAPLEPRQEKLRNFEALSELMEYCVLKLGKLVILLEDLHWADNLSIQFLEYLGRNLEGRNIFICGTCRKEKLEKNSVLKRMITNLRNEDYFTQVELRPLRFKGLYSFLDSTITPGSNSSELTRYLMEKTGGNPFFVEEIMRTLLKKKGVNIGRKMEIGDLKQISIPGTVEEIVLKRIKDLDRTSKEIVKFGSVIIRDFNYDLMKRLTSLDDTELSRALWELKRRQVLIEEDNKYRFYHAALREAINKRMAYREKRKLYYQTGRILELIYKRNTEGVVEDLAYYFINAKDRKRGVSYGLRAAKKSSERYAPEQAIKFYKSVLDVLPDRNPELRSDILQKLARMEVLADYYEDAINHFNRALSLRTESIDKQINIYLGVSSVYEKEGEYNKALRVYRSCLRLLKKMKPCRLKDLLKADVNVKMSKAYLIIGDYKNTTKYNFDGKFYQDLKGRETNRLLADIYTNIGATEIYKGIRSKIDYNKAIACYKKVYKYSKKIKADDKIANALNYLGICYYYKYEYQKAFHYYQKAIHISEKIGDHYGMLYKMLNLGVILKERGCYSEALDCFQRVHLISKRIGNLPVIGGSLLRIGACFVELCNYERAKEYFDKAMVIYKAIDWKDEMGFLIRGIGNIHLAMGEYTLALRFYRKALKISRDIRHQRKIADLFNNISSAFIEIGQFSKAKRYIKETLKITNTLELRDVEIDCYINLCQINLITKDYITANNYYKKGARMAEELGTKLQFLQFLLLSSEIYYREKRYFKGIKIVNKSIKLAKKMGTKDLYAKALLNRAKCEGGRGVLSKMEVIRILDEAKKIAEDIGCPEILWKVYFEYGRFFQTHKEYFEALEYYQKCNRIFGDVGSRIKNETYKKSYLDRPDRQAVYAAKNEIKNYLIDLT